MWEETIDFRDVVSLHVKLLCCFMFLDESLQRFFRLFHENVIFNYIILCYVNPDLDTISVEFMVGLDIVIEEKFVASDQLSAVLIRYFIEAHFSGLLY